MPVSHEKDGIPALKSVFFLSNNFGHFLVPFVLVVVAMATQAKGRVRLALYALAAVLGAELLMTETRGAWIAAIVGILVVGAVLDRRLLLGVLVVPVLLVAFVPSVTERVTSVLPDPGDARSESSLTWRFEHWTEVLPMVEESPVTGVGLDETQRRTGKEPHNDFLLVLVEMGLAGLAVYLWFLGAAVLTGLRATRRVIEPRLPVEPLVHGVTVALFGYAVAFIVASTGENLLENVTTLWVVLPALAAVSWVAHAPRARPGPRPTYSGRAPRPAVAAMDRFVSGDQLLAPRHRRALHLVRRAGYRLRPGPRELPRYFIVGAKRAGTTSLDEYINAHPLVLRGLVEKGCRYYDVNYGRGPDWFRNQLLPVAEVDRLERKLGQRPIIGESSPYYAYHPEAAAPDRGRRAGRAADLRPPRPGRAGLVALPLRGGPRLRDLDPAEAFAAEAEHAWPSPTTGPGSTTTGTSATPTGAGTPSSWSGCARHFDPEQILVIESEQLFADPKSTMETVFAHLSLDPVPLSSYETFKGQSGERRPADAARLIRAAVADDVARLKGLLEQPPSWAG